MNSHGFLSEAIAIKNEAVKKVFFKGILQGIFLDYLYKNKICYSIKIKIIFLYFNISCHSIFQITIVKYIKQILIKKNYHPLKKHAL